ncbi:alpha/beta fold hydrolase [Undibacterium terreum]|uniref:Alpha/beta hydrolase n=1 Tax=Undibacterium terreum TaxID=1224302 RepID=A0A916UAD0_9BURK|nr:alpha/beta hydrolase [Undibacterium terreum]GGC65031.1 alpha/beta hydrolase [Undibacterium terreum]
MKLASSITITLAAAAALAVPALSFAVPNVVPYGAKNVILVHGAYVDGTNWRAIHDQLWLKGYKVTVVQQPNTTLEEDVAVTREAIEAQDGPVILVGHDTGGAVISVAGTSDKVKALVYIAALQPEVGESIAQLTASKPAVNNDVLTDAAGRQSLDPAKFREDFGADLPPNRTNFMSISQTKMTPATLNAKLTAAAWHTKPSYAIVATEDRAINPELQRWMSKRAGSKVSEIQASHSVHLSKPEEVGDFIAEAALNAK